MENDKQIIEIIKQNSLEKTQAEKMLLPLIKFLHEAKGWEEKAKTIVVTEVGQVKEMADARNARLSLKKIRTAAEDTRKELKERSLREGKAIDGVANIIKAVIVPIEEYLEKQEKFAEEREKERKEKILNERLSILQKYEADPTLYNLKEMTPESFEKLVESIKIGHEAKAAADKKAEEERLKRQKEREAEDERVRLENIELKKQAEEAEKTRAKEKAEMDKKIKEAAEAKEKVEKELADKKKAEQEEKVKLEKETAARKKAEEDERKATEEARKKAEAAPDKAKLLEFAIKLKNIELPSVVSEESKTLVKSISKKLLAISQELENKLLEF